MRKESVSLHRRNKSTTINHLTRTYSMNSVTFTKALVGIQDDLLRFAYKLTADREDANDLLQETSLKALGAISLSTTTAR